MPKAQRPYSRVYWEAIDDPKFADVWDHDRPLATWLRLLVAADMAWPASAALYHGVHHASLSLLCRVGLVDMQTGGRFRIHGLDSERERRSKVARDAVNSRYDSSTDVDGSADMRTTKGVPRRAKQSKDEQSKAENGRAPDDETARHGLPHITAEVAQAAETATGRMVTTLHGMWATELDRLVEDRGADRVVDAIGRAAGSYQERPSWGQLVAKVRNLLEPLPGAERAAPMDAVSERDAFIARLHREAGHAS